MTPQNETRLLELLERIAVALEKRPLASSGAGGDAPSAVEVPFGKNKGKKLGELGDRQLSFYAFTWAPQTSEQYPKPSQRDQAFHNAAKGEAKRRGLTPEAGEGPENAPKATEQPPVSRPAPTTQENIDEDVPF